MRLPALKQGLMFESPDGTKGGSTWAFLSAYPDVRQKGREKEEA